MIKKLLTTGLLLGSLVIAKGQANKVEPLKESVSKTIISSGPAFQAKPSVVAVQDTLWYFYNKNIYRFNNSFYTVKAPHTGSVQVNTEFGNSFLNPSNDNVVITNVVVLARRQANSTSTLIPVTITLYTASPSGVPGASVATATCAVTSTAGAPSSIATFSTPIVANGAYFIGYKANPLLPQDTLNVFLTSAYTATSGAANNLKFGEGLAYIRNNGNLIPTTNYYNTGTAGSELEPIVVPFVGLTYTASATASAPNATATPGAYCANTGISYTNTTNGIVNNRQYNFNEFFAAWSPFTSTITPAAQGDPVHNWSFAGGVPTPTANYSTANVTHTYATTGNSNANLIVKYQRGSGSKVKLQELKTWTLQIVNCGIVGINANTADPISVSVYPNPVVNGKTSVHGLQGVNTIAVYNMLGQMVSTQTSEKEVVSVDLNNQPAGTYMIRVTDAVNNTKIIKVLNQ